METRTFILDCSVLTKLDKEIVSARSGVVYFVLRSTKNEIAERRRRGGIAPLKDKFLHEFFENNRTEYPSSFHDAWGLASTLEDLSKIKTKDWIYVSMVDSELRSVSETGFRTMKYAEFLREIERHEVIDTPLEKSFNKYHRDFTIGVYLGLIWTFAIPFVLVYALAFPFLAGDPLWGSIYFVTFLALLISLYRIKTSSPLLYGIVQLVIGLSLILSEYFVPASADPNNVTKILKVVGAILVCIGGLSDIQNTKKGRILERIWDFLFGKNS